MIKTEIRVLSSQWVDRSLMYPGKWKLTWIKSPFMPWQLLSIEEYKE